jgi:hypothetical protein
MTERSNHEVHAELLIGRTVRDGNGTAIGRLAEIVAKRDGDAFVVSHYLVGPRAWIHRFAVHGLGLRLRGLAWIYRVEWDRMDLTDPEHPRVVCGRDDLPIEYLPPRKRGLRRRPARRMR